ncbi:hypothetical protein HOB06_04005 [archaeon]|nr:hypothetical protein [archaeon]
MTDQQMVQRMASLLENRVAPFTRNCIGTAFYVLGFTNDDRYIGNCETRGETGFVDHVLQQKMVPVDNPIQGSLAVFLDNRNAGIERYIHMAVTLSGFAPFNVFHRKEIDGICEISKLGRLVSLGGTPEFYVKR